MDKEEDTFWKKAVPTKWNSENETPILPQLGAELHLWEKTGPKSPLLKDMMDMIDIEYIDIPNDKESIEIEDNTYKIIDDKNVDFKNLTTEQIIEKINSIILELPFDKKIDVCKSCRHKHGDFKIYNDYIQDGGFCSVCCKYRYVLNYTVVHLVEEATISIDDYYVFYTPNGKSFCGLRKSLNVDDIQEIKNANKKLEIEKIESANNFELELFKIDKSYNDSFNASIKKIKIKACVYCLLGIVLIYIVQNTL